MTGVTSAVSTAKWCTHDGAVTHPPICEHLQVAKDEPLAFHRWYTGVGMDCELLCPACVEARAQGQTVEIKAHCDLCFAKGVDAWGEEGGHLGEPEVRQRPRPVDARLTATELGLDSIADLALARDIPNTTFVLTNEGQIIRVNHADNSALAQGTVPLNPTTTATGAKRPVRKPKLHLSPDARYGAVVTDFGQAGAVIDLEEQRVTMRLEGDENHIDSVPFSLAFSTYGGENVIVHRTNWNRLDVSNPADGTLLTEREVPPFVEGADAFKRLDYFHGALFLSPDGNSLLNDGWNWEPAGRPVVWSLLSWLRDNVWESEKGATKRTIPHQNHYWNQGFCWIDNRHVAVEGIGHPDDEMINGVRIFDVTQSDTDPELAREVNVFAGPSGRLFADGDQLFSADEQGLAIWSIEEGALTGRIGSFSPIAHSAIDGTLIDIKGGAIRRWHYRSNQ